MKKRYLREAYLLDDGILLHGYKDKRGFHPDKGLACGFGTQIIRKKDINSILFYSIKTAKEKLAAKDISNIEIAGGTYFLGIDDGIAETRIYAHVGDFVLFHTTDIIITSETFDDNIHAVIMESLNKSGLTLHEATIKYCLSSENKFFMLDASSVLNDQVIRTFTISRSTIH